MAGSETSTYYVPKGDETEVNVVGEWKSMFIPDDQLRKAVLSFLQLEFE
jgi:hypothetical protein